MTLPRFLIVTCIAALILAGVSGCLSGGADKAKPTTSDSPGSSGSGSESPSADANSSAPATAEPPVANFTVVPTNASTSNLTSGTDLTFNASASVDPAGRNLTYAWTFGDNATAAGVTTNHTYADAGNYSVTLTVTSSASNQSANVTRVLNIIAGAPAFPAPITVTDAGGDGKTPVSDITKIVASRDATALTILFSVNTAQPGSGVDTVVLYDIFFTGTTALNLEVYAYANGGLKLYDNTAGATVTGSKVTVSGNTFTIVVPVAYLDGVKVAAPYAMYFQTYFGEGFAAGVQADDRAPNTGSVVL